MNFKFILKLFFNIKYSSAVFGGFLVFIWEFSNLLNQFILLGI